MQNTAFRVPTPHNEPVCPFLPGSGATESLRRRLDAMAEETIQIPLVIGGERIQTGEMGEVRCPHDHSRVLARFHRASEAHVVQAAEAARRASAEWAAMPWASRAAIFLRMAELLAGPWRDTLNASTMLGQSKTCHQAEIDAACELIDFFRFNVWYASQIYGDQPYSPPGQWNMLDYRPLDGFVLAITPFNFTSIAGNLPTAPALMGNTVLWKPSSTQLLSAWYLLLLFEEAGLPPGVINFIPGSGPVVGAAAVKQRGLAGVHFTGSTGAFNHIWQTVARGLEGYHCYPRLVGETGGKDFVFVHPSADPASVVANLVRGAFEYQGQKCSAASRAYIPKSLWPEIRDQLVSEVESITMGDVRDFSNFVGAVIDNAAFLRISSYIGEAKGSSQARILAGGNPDDSEGYFIDPTVVECEDPHFVTMEEEIFGPLLSLHAYPDEAFEQTLELCDQTSPYALTGAIFARDRVAIQQASRILRHAAGNFYINDKPTGAVVGQQPFGGSRQSGTNDKAGSALNLQRWVSPRTIKETLLPSRDYRYPFMG